VVPATFDERVLEDEEVVGGLVPAIRKEEVAVVGEVVFDGVKNLVGRRVHEPAGLDVSHDVR
jgi:hypothetical protein